VDLDVNVRRFLDGRNAEARDASFDYCFNYFQTFRDSGTVALLAGSDNILLSCLHLGFYLASWGMLRGSTELSERSVRYLIPVVEVIARTDPSFWEIDADCYTDANLKVLDEEAAKIRNALPGMSDILLTKIMLGVFGSVPAFDTNFMEACRLEGMIQTFGVEVLKEIGKVYKDNAAVIDAHLVPTFDFISGQYTSRRYTRAKVIDMAFYIEGERLILAKPPAGHKKLLKQAAALGRRS